MKDILQECLRSLASSVQLFFSWHPAVPAMAQPARVQGYQLQGIASQTVSKLALQPY